MTFADGTNSTSNKFLLDEIDRLRELLAAAQSRLCEQDLLRIRIRELEDVSNPNSVYNQLRRAHDRIGELLEEIKKK